MPLQLTFICCCKRIHNELLTFSSHILLLFLKLDLLADDCNLLNLSSLYFLMFSRLLGIIE